MGEDSCDVVIPCRDEAPGPACPPGRSSRAASARSWSTTARATTPPRWPAVSAPRWSPSRGPATAQPCTPGSRPPRPEYVAVMDGDGSMDPAELVAAARRGAQRAGRPRGRSPPAGLPRGVALARPRGQRDGALVAAPPDRAAAARHRPHARGPPRGAPGARRGGPPLRLPGRAAAAGRQRAHWRFVERDISYHPRAAGTKSKVSGSVLGTIRTARDFARVLS